MIYKEGPAVATAIMSNLTRFRPKLLLLVSALSNKTGPVKERMCRKKTKHATTMIF
jgi:hypothetical protein